MKSRSTVGRCAVQLVLGSLLLFAAAGLTPKAEAQTETVAVAPGVVNLGMTATVVVSPPTPGSYTVVVTAPGGEKASANLTFSSPPQPQNLTLGDPASGLKEEVDQAGTYGVFLEQGTELVGSTSLYATDKINLSMDMVTGGTCDYISGATRGMKMFPRFYPTYSSDGAAVTNDTKGAYVTYTLPNGTTAEATWHPPDPQVPDQGGSGGDTGYFIGELLPNWNYPDVGTWAPTVVVGDAFGNTVTYKYSGSPFTISPATLDVGVQLVDARSGEPVTSLQDGQTVTIKATITYPNNAEPVSGFVGPLDSALRGGVVNVLVGWGYYNSTTGSFGGKTPGGLIAKVPMTYSGSTSTWVGSFAASSLPSLQAGTGFVVAVSARDAASPPNMGASVIALPPGAQPAQGIPSIAYAGMAVFLLVGVVVGYLARSRK